VKAKEFVNKLRHKDIVEAIREAEATTSGEIRVYISSKEVSDPVEMAKQHFSAMGMTKTRERNGVLIFVAPQSHKFAVIGDTGVHAKCGEKFWNELIGEMSPHFREAHYSRALIHAVQKTGKFLAEHFPRRADDVNELPDEVEGD
jgi:uncharacterized membrane protein